MFQKLVVFSLLISTLPSVFITSHAQSEPDDLTLRLSKVMGYSSGTGKVQGMFNLKASGPENLVKVAFYLDGQALGDVSEAPYSIGFSTDAYPLGLHELSATGSTQDGKQLNSNIIQVEFVTPDQGMQAALKIVFPLLGIILVAVLFSTVLPLVLTGRRTGHLPLGSPRQYGVFGGSICPKCQRPFSLHIYGLNMGLSKLDRCPFCGKWSLVRRSTPQDLASAEIAEIPASGEEKLGETEEEDRFRRSIADSKYEDL